ncbi:hypothetical protein EX30DRAFT_396964 [Ascodesmis nigricans]|uniref:PPP4R2-domain-containing protein n=1 Tax=Ascodesmis nigricans TaxID=341454 RepID=A0A4S2MT26_9PEZI|nr:hypothetical protein EX30DRAFT_396964 [Ascodesmis nigricans]
MSTEEILEECIRTGTIDVATWPELLPRLVARLESIAHNEFPGPTQSELSVPPTADPPQNSLNSAVPESSQSSHTLSSPLSTDDHQSTVSHTGLHPEDAAQLASLSSTLSSFTTAPPHTFQRLFELLLCPTKPYKSLPAYFRALFRVLSVYSPSTTFPLPTTALDSSDPLSLTNGDHSTTNLSFASDESLGGALLTPIPWLQGIDEDAARSGVSQGELLRREQELGLVPASQIENGGNGSEGPPGIDAQDVGPQPEGTVFPDPPRSEEEIELKDEVETSAESEERDGERDADGDVDMEKDGEGGVEMEKKEEKTDEADGQPRPEEKEDDAKGTEETDIDIDMDAPAELEEAEVVKDTKDNAMKD